MGSIAQIEHHGHRVDRPTEPAGPPAARREWNHGCCGVLLNFMMILRIGCALPRQCAGTSCVHMCIICICPRPGLGWFCGFSEYGVSLCAAREPTANRRFLCIRCTRACVHPMARLHMTLCAYICGHGCNRQVTMSLFEGFTCLGVRNTGRLEWP